ncbi:unnamed protein product [Strongylus vulgaris]|uniref:6-phosphofructo-2-kinase domain-containing protein n=1 Tax=Strongylus vulgaris TaxID=40348 RepID=A0A3P7L916_STRVU|nr:unnamed protein product [Strongylus vulgaris]
MLLPQMSKSGIVTEKEYQFLCSSSSLSLTDGANVQVRVPNLSLTDGANVQVRVPNVIALVGLPARGKTYISHKLCRYLNWIGIKTREKHAILKKKVSSSSALTTQKEIELGSEFFEKHPFATSFWQGLFLENILDATNTTRARRRMLAEFCCNRRTLVDPPFRVFFVESICDDPRIINSNITVCVSHLCVNSEVKINSPDYKGIMSHEEAKEDFLKRIENYKLQYEPLDEEEDEDLSFIKVINAGQSFYVHNVNGHVQSRVVYFLMNIHLLPRCIYLTRVGNIELKAIHE